MTSQPSRADFPFFFPFRVRYNETDQQGVVFYGNYSIYYDVALGEFLRWAGHDYKNQERDTGTDFHIVRSAVDFLTPLEYDDEIEVGARIARLGEKSLTWAGAVFRKGADAPVSTAEIVWVNADQSNGQSAPVPPALRALLEAKMGAAVE
jgi:acyl-CoA thioester hydrolase